MACASTSLVPEGIASFDALPDEVIIHIFSYLSHYEMYKVARLVCKRWRLLVSTPSLWRIIRAGPEISLRFLKIWMRRSVQLRELYLLRPNKIPETMILVAKQAPNLRVLSLGWIAAGTDVCVVRGRLLRDLAAKCIYLEIVNLTRITVTNNSFSKCVLLNGVQEWKASKFEYGHFLNERQLQIVKIALDHVPKQAKTKIDLTFMKKDSRITVIVLMIKDVQGGKRVFRFELTTNEED